MRRAIAAALAVACLSVLPGCEWRGLNSLTLPGTEGGGDGSYTIQAQLPDVVVIQQNTRVRVADVNVGNVTKIEVQDWHALVTMRIDGNVHLPANSTAKVGQTSLLGSMHIELAPPEEQPALQPVELPPMEAHHIDASTGMDELAMADAAISSGGRGQGFADKRAPLQTRKAEPGTTVNPKDPATWGRVSRNAPCPCGSGKKYKHCHGKYD